MDSLVVLSLLVSFVIGDQGFKEDPANFNSSSAVRYMESILQEFNQDTRWGTLDTAEMVISSMMPVTDHLDNLRFDVSKLDGAFQTAELRIFRHTDPGCDFPVVMVRQNQCEGCELIKSKTGQGERSKGGWLVFNVTKAVHSWMEDPGRNQGFTIFAGCNNIKLGIREKLSPLMVCYSKRNPGQDDIQSLVKIKKRSVTLDYGLQSIPLFNRRTVRMMIKNHRTVKKNLNDYKNTTEPCGNKSFDLGFEDIRRNYIVVPKRINFTSCSGILRCGGFILKRFRRNSACLPSFQVRVLYFNMKDEIVIREVLNVNAEECSCE